MLVICSLLGLLPLVFKVHTGMTQVISLFAFVTRDQITKLAERCEIFRECQLQEIHSLRPRSMNTGLENLEDEDSLNRSMIDFLSESSRVDDPMDKSSPSQSNSSHSYEGDDSFNQSYEKKEKIDQQLEELKNNDLMEDSDFIPKNRNSESKSISGDKGGSSSQLEHKNAKRGRNDSSSKSRSRTRSSGQTKNRRKKSKILENSNERMKQETLKNMERDENAAQEEEEEKREVLNSFKEGFTQVYLFKALITSFILSLILVGNYLWTSQLCSSAIHASTHLNHLSELNTKLKYLNIFTLETVAQNSIYRLEGKNMIEEYGNQIYDMLNKLNSDVKQSFHFTLTSYEEMYSKISNEDICQNFFANEPSYNFTGCVSDEFFTKGLQTLIIKINEDTRSIGQGYTGKVEKDYAVKVPAQTARRLQNIDLFTMRIGFTIDFLLSVLTDNLVDMMATFDLGDYLIIFGLAGVLLVMYFGLWMPFVNSLQARIWRAQGMVNMIPFKIINENKALSKSMEKSYFV